MAVNYATHKKTTGSECNCKKTLASIHSYLLVTTNGILGLIAQSVIQEQQITTPTANTKNKNEKSKTKKATASYKPCKPPKQILLQM